MTWPVQSLRREVMTTCPALSRVSRALVSWAASSVSGPAESGAAEVTTDRLINSEREPQNWLNHHGNLEAHRFSSLKQINKSNVKNLRVAFTWAMGGTEGGGKDLLVFPFAGLACFRLQPGFYLLACRLVFCRPVGNLRGYEHRLAFENESVFQYFQAVGLQRGSGRRDVDDQLGRTGCRRALGLFY